MCVPSVLARAFPLVFIGERERESEREGGGRERARKRESERAHARERACVGVFVHTFVKLLASMQNYKLHTDGLPIDVCLSVCLCVY